MFEPDERPAEFAVIVAVAAPLSFTVAPEPSLMVPEG
jgi:hypothetical protein